MNATKRADQIKPGDKVIERDGYALDVEQVQPLGKLVVLHLRSMMGQAVSIPLRKHQLVKVTG